MPTVNCPHCDNKLEFSIGVADDPLFVRPAKYDRLISDLDGQISEVPVRAVLAFLRATGPGHYSSRMLYSKYAEWRQENGGPGLSQASFGRAMKLAGAIPTRTAKQREYEIPEDIDTLEPVRPYINSRRAQRAAHRRAVEAHTGVDKSPAGPTPAQRAALAQRPIEASPDDLEFDEAEPERPKTRAEILAELPFEIDMDPEDWKEAEIHPSDIY